MAANMFITPLTSIKYKMIYILIWRFQTCLSPKL